MAARPEGARLLMLLLLLISVALSKVAEPDGRDNVIHSLRRALRETRAVQRKQITEVHGHQLSATATGAALAAGAPQLCSDSNCRIDLTTGVARWLGAGETIPNPNWAPTPHGAWIGYTNPAHAPSVLIASVSFYISEPGCASFHLAFAADGRVQSAQLNGKALAVPSHGHRTTTSQVGTSGLVAARGLGLFALGTNILVLTVTNYAGVLGLYVRGSVQLLCPLDEATVFMKPTRGPTAGHTTITLTSNIKVTLPPLLGTHGNQLCFLYVS